MLQYKTVNYSANLTTPKSLVAGDTAEWRIALDDYSPADGWQLHYRFIGNASNYNIEGTVDGNAHLISFSGATTSAWLAGEYQLIGYVTNGAGDRHTISDTRISIAANLAALTNPLDTRSSAKKALDAINLALETYGEKAYTKQLSMNGRTLAFNTPAEFMAFREQLKNEVAREKNAEKFAAQGFGKVLVRF